MQKTPGIVDHPEATGESRDSLRRLAAWAAARRGPLTALFTLAMLALAAFALVRLASETSYEAVVRRCSPRRGGGSCAAWGSPRRASRR